MFGLQSETHSGMCAITFFSFQFKFANVCVYQYTTLVHLKGCFKPGFQPSAIQ